MLGTSKKNILRGSKNNLADENFQSSLWTYHRYTGQMPINILQTKKKNLFRESKRKKHKRRGNWISTPLMLLEILTSASIMLRMRRKKQIVSISIL
jgi:hypothetical protein